MSRPTREQMADHARGLASVVLDMVEGRPVTIGEAAVRMGASRRTAMRLLQALDEEIGARVERRPVDVGARWPNLTRTERAIVEMLARHQGKFVHARQLAERLGYDVTFNLTNTVRAHIGGARRKGVRIITERDRGYALVLEEAS